MALLSRATFPCNPDVILHKEGVRKVKEVLGCQKLKIFPPVEAVVAPHRGIKPSKLVA